MQNVDCIELESANYLCIYHIYNRYGKTFVGHQKKDDENWKEMYTQCYQKNMVWLSFRGTGV